MRYIEAEPNVEVLIDAPQLLTIEEVASLLRVDAATVARWTKEKRLVSIKVGPRLHRFPKVSVEEYLQDTAFQGTNN